MSGHTKEPWFQSHRQKPDGMYDTEIYDADGKTIAVVSWYSVKVDGGLNSLRPLNARRIVACVNVCAGIETEALENVDGFPQAVGREMQRIVLQRNELLGLLKEIRPMFNNGDAAIHKNMQGGIFTWFDRVDTAIARAEAP